MSYSKKVAPVNPIRSLEDESTEPINRICPASECDIKIEIKLEFNENSNDIDAPIKEDTDDTTENHEHAIRVAFEVIERILKTVVKKNLFVCKKCEYSTRDNHNLARHTETMHSKLVIKCLTCSKVFEERFAFVKHRVDCCHVCIFAGCNKLFKKKSKFEAHERMHIKLLSRY